MSYPAKMGVGMGKGRGLAKRSARAHAPRAVAPVASQAAAHRVTPVLPDSSLRRLNRPVR